ncbi:unnamed protein product [Cylicocyclus nassatus]|uniref:Uncharacterized protein n=1 Tax=Cylicocyclus nassatus TaxID=53992 RepID=A0AA36M6I5_CYLNA|nr:unnamed protein product [Cylicocyclus nassatus]
MKVVEVSLSLNDWFELKLMCFISVSSFYPCGGHILRTMTDTKKRDETVPEPNAVRSIDYSSEKQYASLREPPSTELYPSLPSSVSMPTYPSDLRGEKLQHLSETEWDRAQMAFPSDFLNLERNSERVSVFAAADKALEHQLRVEERRRLRKLAKRNRRIEAALRKKRMQAIETFAQLVTAVTALLNEDRVKSNGIEIRVSIRINGPYGIAKETTVTSN